MNWMLSRHDLHTMKMMVDKCLRCGKCCYLTLYTAEGVTIRTKIRCRFLTSDNLCSVYDNRPDWCLTAEQMMKLNILPDGCGYKEGE